MKYYLRFFSMSSSVIFLFIALAFVGVSSDPSTSASTQAQEEDQENVVVDVAASAKRSRAGKQAFDKMDYILAKKECEAALKLNPDNVNARNLLEETKEALGVVNDLIRDTVSLFKSKQNDEAFEKLHEVQQNCVNYPAAEALFKKAAQILVDEGWDAYGGDNIDEALEKAEEALKFVPNDSGALELLKECGEKPTKGAASDSDSNSFLQKKAGARATLKYNGVEFAFRYCPPSRYTKAPSWNKSGRYMPKGFWIGETETTQAQWDAVGGEKQRKCRTIGKNLPVENISWEESVAFVGRLNALDIAPKGWRFVLPLEELWEYACFAGTTGDYLDNVGEYAWYKENSGDKSHEVGTKKPNQWGIYDMLGNVTEWTGSSVPGVTIGIVRGGSWYDDAQGCNPTKRQKRRTKVFDTFDHLGFRLALVRIR